MLGFASLRLIMNSRAAFRTSSLSASALSSPAVVARRVGDSGAAGGGKEKERLGGLGKGFVSVGVGPQSAAGRMRAGRKARSALKWGAKRVGAEVQSGVREERNLARLAGEDWRFGSVESIGYRRERDCDSCGGSQAVR
jgi:hypothetical protein